MRQRVLVAGLTCAVLVSGCQSVTENAVDRKLQDVNVVAESELSDVMLTVADPNEAVDYFARTSAQNPEDITFKRGLGLSLLRAKDNRRAVTVWKEVINHDDSTNDDKLKYAEALIKTGDWAGARQVLNDIPPTHETYDRYRLEAIVADSNKEWKRADSFYEIAAGLTTTPASVLNNWGFSKLTRGDAAGAEKLFAEAAKHDNKRFVIKNNLALARAAQGNYTLPIVPMTQTERAELLHTMGLSAAKRGDIAMAKTLFRDAVSTHPQYFEAANRSLNALENS